MPPDTAKLKAFDVCIERIVQREGHLTVRAENAEHAYEIVNDRLYSDDVDVDWDDDVLNTEITDVAEE